MDNGTSGGIYYINNKKKHIMLTTNKTCSYIILDPHLVVIYPNNGPPTIDINERITPAILTLDSPYPFASKYENI